MRVVIQRVKEARVTIKSQKVAEIGVGLCIFLGIQVEDSSMDDIKWLCKKIANLRIFNDSNGVMNHSLKELEKEILLISQFTLYANTKKGNRPSFVKSAPAETAEPLYKLVRERLEEEIGRKISTGVFGADMQVDLCNDGPVTIIIDTQNKEL